MYRTVFDISDGVPWEVLFPLFVMCVMAAMGVLLLRVTQGRAPIWFERQAAQLEAQRPIPKWFPWVWLFCIAMMFALVGVPLVQGHWHYRKALTSGAHHMVEGRVEGFASVVQGNGKSRRVRETFSVNGVSFEYGDGASTPGFEQTQSRGGPIHEGLAVRIAYTSTGTRNAILKLDIDERAPRNVAAQETPVDPLPLLVFGFFGAGFFANVWFFHRAGDATRKRRWFAAYAVASLVGFALLIFYVWQAPALLAVLFAGVNLISLRTTAFCDRGHGVRTKHVWKRPTECDKCGATLTPDSQPWLRWL